MVNLPSNIGDVSFTPGIRHAATPGRSAEARGVFAPGGGAPGQSASPSSASAFRGSDSVELSSAARSAGDRPIRSDLVDRVRREIADGSYDADDKKLDVVADKIFAKLFGDVQG